MWVSRVLWGCMHMKYNLVSSRLSLSLSSLWYSWAAWRLQGSASTCSAWPSTWAACAAAAKTKRRRARGPTPAASPGPRSPPASSAGERAEARGGGGRELWCLQGQLTLSGWRAGHRSAPPKRELWLTCCFHCTDFQSVCVWILSLLIHSRRRPITH